LRDIPYFRGFLLTLATSQKKHRWNMDTLITLSCYLAWGYGLLIAVYPAMAHELSGLAGYLADPLVTLNFLLECFTHRVTEG